MRPAKTATASPHSPATLFTVAGLSKRFGRLPALADVGFDVRAGEVLGLIGPNGAGKTTLFECLAGLLPADAGRVQAAGRNLAPRERTPLLFYLPDGIAPWPAQSVRWALDFTIGFFGGPPALRDDLVEQLDLDRLLRQPIGALSKGERKRVLLAIGLLTPQPVLLADEPFDGLDLRQTREVAGLLRAHATRGRTLFLSIHQITDAARVCDRFVLLSSGRVRGEGTLEELSMLASGRTTSHDLEEVFLALT
jgi:ABC-type multidrug transport system ATPase subunit